MFNMNAFRKSGHAVADLDKPAERAHDAARESPCAPPW